MWRGYIFSNFISRMVFDFVFRSLVSHHQGLNGKTKTTPQLLSWQREGAQSANNCDMGKSR